MMIHVGWLVASVVASFAVGFLFCSYGMWKFGVWFYYWRYTYLRKFLEEVTSIGPLEMHFNLVHHKTPFTGRTVVAYRAVTKPGYLQEELSAELYGDLVSNPYWRHYFDDRDPLNVEECWEFVLMSVEDAEEFQQWENDWRRNFEQDQN